MNIQAVLVPVIVCPPHGFAHRVISNDMAAVFGQLLQQSALGGRQGLAGGVSGMLLASRGYWYAWPYCLMQRGMNANQSSDMLADSYLGFALACVGWLALILLAVQLLLSHQDVKVR